MLCYMVPHSKILGFRSKCFHQCFLRAFPLCSLQSLEKHHMLCSSILSTVSSATDCDSSVLAALQSMPFPDGDAERLRLSPSFDNWLPLNATVYGICELGSVFRSVATPVVFELSPGHFSKCFSAV